MSKKTTSVTRSESNYLFVLPWNLVLPGGVNTVVGNLCRQYLTSGRFRPMLLVNSWDHQDITTIVESTMATSYFRMQRMPIRGRTRAKEIISFLIRCPITLLKLRQFILRHAIDVVNPHFPGPDMIYFVVLKKLFRAKFKLIASLHGSDVTAMEENAQYASAMSFLLLQSDAITVPSKSLSDRLTIVCPKLEGRVHCIYNGVDRRKFEEPQPEAPFIQQDLQDRQFVLHLGLNRGKGVDVLLKAFCAVRKDHPHMHLVLAGQNGAYVNEIRKEIAALDLGHCTVILTDRNHDDIPSVMNKAAFVVLPSRLEGGVPLTLLEAAIARRAVIATDVGGIPELIINQQNGLLIPPNSAEPLATAMALLISDSHLRSLLAKNLFERVQGSFSWEHTARGYVHLTE